ncbi:hypothetical protein CHLRE_01g003826v5 [Chlamydomonas reinhardtii]|uniref:Uncharacterized protein n=1 Tax=Chlamydomonas reinhardtii TaxID=3055 RepID=A0A2K3E522_CHLRE|nr:uncharacterized protein CHLRE_01g003826v5 [Chlamydomonas reinhardtii]PNW87837.1 hypothetical protein CHLRE_01g003826v5 [Chlamydomonas reinhardtii]
MHGRWRVLRRVLLLANVPTQDTLQSAPDLARGYLLATAVGNLRCANKEPVVDVSQTAAAL